MPVGLVCKMKNIWSTIFLLERVSSLTSVMFCSTFLTNQDNYYTFTDFSSTRPAFTNTLVKEKVMKLSDFVHTIECRMIWGRVKKKSGIFAYLDLFCLTHTHPPTQTKMWQKSWDKIYCQ